MESKYIYKILSGSRLYGTDTPNSDYDYRGVWLPTLEESLNMEKLKDVKSEIADDDILIYPLQKFIRLAASGNPNVLDWFFAPKEQVEIIKPEMNQIIQNSDMFIAKHIIPKIFGFAKGEYESVAKKTSRKTGAKRKKEMEKFGYSPKNAMNAIRVLQQGAELILTGKITFPRQNREELRKIKTGQIKEADLDDLYQEALSAMRVAEKMSLLPAGPDIEGIEKIMFDVLTNEFKLATRDDWVRANSVNS